MKKLLLFATFCLPVSMYCMEDSDAELEKLKKLSMAALLKKCPKKQNNQKTGMSESYLTFIQEPISSINPYLESRDDRKTNEEYFSIDVQMQAILKKIQFLIDKEKKTKND